MIIDNFDIIADMIPFKKQDQMFAFVQIVARAKDHPRENISESAIQEYYVRSKEELLRLKKEIVALVQLYGARAYINISPKSFKTLQENLTRVLVDKTIIGEVHSPRHLLKSIAGKLKSKNPVWVIDTDTTDEGLVVKNWLDERDIPWKFVETASFGHFLTDKFNSNEFEKSFPEIHLHKNSMGTMLYFEYNARSTED